MSRFVIVALLVDETVTDDQVHEALCLTIHEGAEFEHVSAVEDIRVVGSFEPANE